MDFEAGSCAGMRLEVQLNFSDEERSAMLKHSVLLAKATEVMGRKLALEWMSRPALGLDQQRPAALLRTTDGAQAVEDFLERLCHGVYS